MKKPSPRLILVLCILCFTHFAANSSLLALEINSTVTSTQAWFNFGFGPVSFDAKYASNGLMSFSYASNGKILTARYMFLEEKYIDIDDYKLNRVKKVKDFSVLYGLMSKRRFGFASAAIGLGLTKNFVKDENTAKDFLIMGISLEIQTFFTLPGMGVGLYGFANINPELPYYGISITLQVGKLR